MVTTIEIKTNDKGQVVPWCLDTGRPLLNQHDPEEEARRILSYIAVDEAQLIVIVGLGFGYLLKEVQKSAHPHAKILVIDADEEMTKLAKETNCLTPFETDDRITFVIGDKQLRSDVVNKFISENYMFVHRSLILDSFYYSNAERTKYTKHLLEEYSGWRNSLQFLIGNDPDDTLKGLRQLVENIPAVVNGVALSQWKGRLSSTPAICVASGPSLDKNIELLKQVGDKALIVAADSIVERLYEEGIKPHIITIIERNEVLYTRFFKDKVFHDGAILVGYCSIFPEVFRTFSGKVIPIGRNGILHERVISEILPGFDVGQLGQSCAHLSFSTAHTLGCDPIILVGQDLSYGKGKITHANGVNDEEEQKEVEEVLDKVASLELEVKGYYGGKVLTSVYWKQFKELFEKWMLAKDRLYINATEGGAYIEGAEHVSLSQTFEKYLGDSDISSVISEINRKDSSDNIPFIGNLIQQFTLWLEENEKCEAHLEAMRQLALDIADSMNDPATHSFSDITKRFTEHISQFADHSIIVSQVTQYPILKYIEKINNLYIITDEDQANWVNYLRELSNDLTRYTGMIREYLEKGIYQLREIEKVTIEQG